MLKPLAKRVLVKPVEIEETTASGLVLPSSAQEKENVGEIVAVGNDIEEKDGVKVGDRVVYKQFGATEVKDEGADYLILEIKDVLAVFE